MAGRTPPRWTYRVQPPIRRARVVAADAPRGVLALVERAPKVRITPMQARIAILAAIVVMMIICGRVAYRSSFLTVSEVRISGTTLVPPEDVTAAANVSGKSIFGLDLAGAEARVAALPMVRSATLTKHGYNSVSIRIDERTVWGSWQINGVNVPVDVDGYVMAGMPAAAGSPVIIDV